MISLLLVYAYACVPQPTCGSRKASLSVISLLPHVQEFQVSNSTLQVCAGNTLPDETSLWPWIFPLLKKNRIIKETSTVTGAT